MDDDANIAEVCFFGGKVLVTFADGMMALLEPGMIRRLAVEADALKPSPQGNRMNDGSAPDGLS
jgi:hypothetical protein